MGPIVMMERGLRRRGLPFKDCRIRAEDESMVVAFKTQSGRVACELSIGEVRYDMPFEQFDAQYAEKAARAYMAWSRGNGGAADQAALDVANRDREYGCGMIQIEIGRIFSLFCVPFWWREVKDDRYFAPVLRVMLGRWMFTLDGRGFRSRKLY